MPILRARRARASVIAAVALSGLLPGAAHASPIAVSSSAVLSTASVTAPTGLKATVSGGAVDLSWDASTAADFSYYAVRRGTQPDPTTGTWTRLAPNYTTPQAVDSGLAPGTYSYYVTAVSTTGTVSARSTVVTVTIPATTATSPSVAVSTPTGLTASASGNSVSLDWDDNTGSAFSYFAVRRGTQADPTTGTWTRLAPNYTLSAAVDSGLTAGTYYYYVTAVSTTGTVSGRSAVVPVTVGANAAPEPGAQGVTKVLTVVEENHSLSEMQSGMPYLYGLAKQYGYASNYSAITHPSLPNYMAIAGGSTFGVTDDNPPSSHPLSGASVFGQALAAGRTAKTYAESMTSNCALTSSGNYAVKHNPWAYFTAERTSCGRSDVPMGTPTSGALASDIAANALPNAGMVIPNLCNDAHNCSLGTADAWLKSWLPAALASADFTSGRLAIVVTADEDDSTAGNKVLTVVLHSSLHGRVVTSALTHYSLTRLYAQVVGATPLRNGSTAPDLAAAFGLPLGASSPTPTPTATATLTPSPTPSPAPAPATTSAPAGIAGSWTMAFDDEFNGTSLDTNKWSPSWYGGGTMNNVATSPANVSVANGDLALTLSSTTTGALVSTRKAAGAGTGYDFGYGVAEARILFPAAASGGCANWPAWWTSGEAWPSAGENDVAEVLSGKVTVNYHSSPSSTNYGEPAPGGWCGAWHTFAIDREAGHAAVYYDGKLVKDYPTADGGALESLILNMGASSNAVVGAKMLVDYVRVWKAA